MRSPNSMRGLRQRLAIAIAIAIGFGVTVPAFSAPGPAQLSPTFQDRTAQGPAASKASPACVVNVVEIVDERRSPDVIGVIGRRAVLAPKDFQAWMKAVLGGLTARGVTVRYDPAADSGSQVPTARLALQIASIQATVETYSASVVIRLKAEGPAGAAIDKGYRGRVARTSYWSSGTGTLQSAVDGAFADALDSIAADLKAVCASPTT